MGLTFVGPVVAQQAAPATAIRVAGRHFIDERGRVVLLRGVNLSGDAKVPPYRHVRDESDLDPLVELGFNVVRLVFIWEAFEPLPGAYDQEYLAYLRSVASACRARGLHVILDVHQDGYSRHCSKGAGDGFPRWAVSRRARPSDPDNGPGCKDWPVLMATDRATHRSFHDFYADANGVRTRFLAMLARLAEIGAEAGVIGYVLINEPWGDERDDLARLYRDSAAAIRSRHPSAVLFFEGHITTNSGLATKLERPDAGLIAYAPHYYRPLTILMGRWHGASQGIDRAFANMSETARSWDCPLFLGEYGVAANARNAGDYVSAIQDRLDAALASGAQWNYTPNHDARRKDGWNAEDFSILDREEGLRPNFRPGPFPRATAGMPLVFRYTSPEVSRGRALVDFQWQHDPRKGETEVYLPSAVFGPSPEVRTNTPDATVVRAGQCLLITCSCVTTIRLVVEATR
jgi:endoglycosylceramidase